MQTLMKCWFVLILVFVELTFRDYLNKYIKNEHIKSLNPCFCGTYFSRGNKTKIAKEIQSLNPCFCGTYFSSNTVAIGDRQAPRSLNPCFCGTYFSS